MVRLKTRLPQSIGKTSSGFKRSALAFLFIGCDTKTGGQTKETGDEWLQERT